MAWRFFTMLLVSMLFTGLSSAQAQSNASCSRIQAIKAIQQAATAVGATIEPVHLKGGVTIVVTANNPAGVGALHNAADNYLAARTKSLATKTASGCEQVWGALAEGQLDESVEKTSTGFIIAYTSTDPKIVQSLHKDTCCQYCICPSTVTRCSGCC